MSDGYGTHKEYFAWARKDADLRKKKVERSLREAFADFIEKKEVEVVLFSNMNAFDLSKAISDYPLILKPLLAACNIAARAIERDLSIKNVDTYRPKLDDSQAKVIAGYIKPFLPPFLELPAITQIDRLAFIDKEIRKLKGRWERKILDMLNRFSKLGFKKRKFVVDGESFELDGVYPKIGSIKAAVDIKRIEARRDIHKRCDEIVNKAAKLKGAYPESKFGAVVYYPFIDEQINIQNRLRSSDIDCLVFASEADISIENAVKILLSSMRIRN